MPLRLAGFAVSSPVPAVIGRMGGQSGCSVGALRVLCGLLVWCKLSTRDGGCENNRWLFTEKGKEYW